MAQTKKQQAANKGNAQTSQGGNDKKPYVHKPGQGSLFKNLRKQAENHPDLQGSFTDADGNEYWLSAWKHTNNNGTYFSINATLKDQQQGQGNGGGSKNVDADDLFN